MTAKVNPKFSFALALLILSGIAGLSIYWLRESGKAVWWAQASIYLGDELNTSLILMERSQSAVRGFTLTGREESLKPYHSATNALPTLFERLDWYMGLGEREREGLEMVKALMLQRLADLETTIRVARNEGMPAAQKRIAEGTGDHMQEQLSEFVDDFRKEYFRVHRSNVVSDRLSRTTALTVVVAGSVLSFALVLFSFILLQRQIQQRDIAERAARESKDRLQLVLRGVRAGVWHVQLHPRTAFWSPEFRDLYGFSPDEPATTERWRSVIHSDDIGRVEQEIQSVLRNGPDEWQTEFRIVHPKRQNRWILALVRVWRDATGNPERFGGINLDVTERKQVELQLAHTKRLLQEHTEHLEKTVHERTAKLKDTITELESFSYTVSHDLRSPLRAMHSYAELVLSDYGRMLPADGHALLEGIIHAAKRMDALTLDLLNYSCVVRNDIECQPIDIEAIIAEVVELNPALQAPGAELIIESPLEKMLGHEPLLRHCMANLLDNAVKYVSPGIPPRIRIWSERICSREQPPGSPSFTRLSVKDNGIGIDPRFHRKIFGVFERLLEHPAEGTGVGLAIVAKAVERMGGSCGVESAPGEGSRFWIQLPAAANHGSSARPDRSGNSPRPIESDEVFA